MIYCILLYWIITYSCFIKKNHVTLFLRQTILHYIAASYSTYSIHIISFMIYGTILHYHISKYHVTLSVTLHYITLRYTCYIHVIFLYIFSRMPNRWHTHKALHHEKNLWQRAPRFSCWSLTYCSGKMCRKNSVASSVPLLSLVFVSDLLDLRSKKTSYIWSVRMGPYGMNHLWIYVFKETEIVGLWNALSDIKL